jgi:hypothetical protein
MPRPPRKEQTVCRHFTWLLGRRDDVWQADGRSDRPNVGRYSPGTDDDQGARRLLAELDLTKAIEHGLADPSALVPLRREELLLDEGRRLSMDHVARARFAGGVRESSRKRYRAVFDVSRLRPFVTVMARNSSDQVRNGVP